MESKTYYINHQSTDQMKAAKKEKWMLDEYGKQIAKIKKLPTNMKRKYDSLEPQKREEYDGKCG